MNSKPNDSPLIDVGNYIVVRRFVDVFTRQFYPALVLDRSFVQVGPPHQTDRAAIDAALAYTRQDAEAELAREHGQYISDVRRDAAGL